MIKNEDKRIRSRGAKFRNLTGYLRGVLLYYSPDGITLGAAA